VTGCLVGSLRLNLVAFKEDIEGRRIDLTTLLQHRGYYGSIDASPEDNCLFGKLQFIRALVGYEGDTVSELTQAFRDAVDDYLDTCASLGWTTKARC